MGQQRDCSGGGACSADIDQILIIASPFVRYNQVLILHAVQFFQGVPQTTDHLPIGFKNVAIQVIDTHVVGDVVHHAAESFLAAPQGGFHQFAFVDLFF